MRLGTENAGGLAPLGEFEAVELIRGEHLGEDFFLFFLRVEDSFIPIYAHGSFIHPKSLAAFFVHLIVEELVSLPFKYLRPRVYFNESGISS